MSAGTLSAICRAIIGDRRRSNYTDQTPLLRFFCDLLRCIDFRFAVQVVGLLVRWYNIGLQELSSCTRGSICLLLTSLAK